MKSPDDKDLLCFGHLSCFNSLTEDELAFIQKSTRSLFFKKGETICKQGSFAPYVIFLSEGLAKIYLELTREKQISTHLAKSGDFISFSSIFNHDEYNTSAAALVDSDVCMIEKDAIISLLKSNSDFAYRIIARNWQVYDVMEELEDESDYSNVKFAVMAFDHPEAHIIRNAPECSTFMGLPFTMYYRNGSVAEATSSIQSREQITSIIDRVYQKESVNS